MHEDRSDQDEIQQTGHRPVTRQDFIRRTLLLSGGIYSAMTVIDTFVAPKVGRNRAILAAASFVPTDEWPAGGEGPQQPRARGRGQGRQGQGRGRGGSSTTP